VAWLENNEGGRPSYPITLGSFVTVENTTIEPATLLDDIRTGKNLLFQVRTGLPDNPSFVMSIGWTQSDYLEIANAYRKAIWHDDPNIWHLYKTEFDTSCDSTSGKFKGGEFYYYQEVTKDGKWMYSVRDIYINPEDGYIAWGGDTFYPRSFWGGWTSIDLQNITMFPAEKALAMADQRGGNVFRAKENYICNISVYMWPWGYNRSDWNVFYSGKTHIEIWVPLK
jgi:hypothetical protein